VKAVFERESLLDDGDQGIDRHGDPYLSMHSVLGSAEECLDAKVLLNPFEE